MTVAQISYYYMTDNLIYLLSIFYIIFQFLGKMLSCDFFSRRLKQYNCQPEIVTVPLTCMG